MKEKKLKIALPAGSLKESTIDIIRRAGYRLTLDDRSYRPIIDDREIECMLIRAQEIPRYIEEGKFDIGITGMDWVEESGRNVKRITELKYSKKGFNTVKLVIAVPESSRIRSIKQLEGKTIATELVNLTQKFLKKNLIKSNVEFSWGASESKPPYLADAIAELVDSGLSLRVNNLRVLETIYESNTCIIGNRESYKDEWKKNKIDTFKILLEGVLNAEEMIGLKLNIQEKNLNSIVNNLPALRTPTITKLYEKEWYSVESVLLKTQTRKIIPIIKKIGAEGIVEFSISKLVY